MKLPSKKQFLDSFINSKDMIKLFKNEDARRMEAERLWQLLPEIKKILAT